MNKDLVQKPSFPVTLTKGESWALLKKYAIESTALAQPFCVNQAVGDLPQHLSARLKALSDRSGDRSAGGRQFHVAVEQYQKKK